MEWFENLLMYLSHGHAGMASSIGLVVMIFALGISLTLLKVTFVKVGDWIFGKEGW